MKSILDFTLAALPWLIVGVSLAILFAKGASRKKKESKKTGTTAPRVCASACASATTWVSVSSSICASVLR